MQLRRFYGRTLASAVASVKRELGPEALILDTSEIAAGSAAARMNPGMRYEICAALDGDVRPTPRQTDKPRVRRTPGSQPAPANPAGSTARQTSPRPAPWAEVSPAPRRRSPRELARRRVADFGTGETTPTVPAAHTAPETQPAASPTLLDDMGLLREQLRNLLDHLEDDARRNPELADDVRRGGIDVQDYYAMLELGVEPAVLAPSFRRWLQWRTAAPAVRGYIAQTEPVPAASMHGSGFREWLWLEWLDRQNAAGPGAPEARIQALVGPAGSGKTTTLAKIAAKMRRERGPNIAVATLDAYRFGAVEQWRRLGKLIGVDVLEISDEDQLRDSMATWDRYDWIGIDTPGNLERCAPSRRMLNAISQFAPEAEITLTLPATERESDSRARMRREDPWTSKRVLFTKLDVTTRPGALINLTMDGSWGIVALTDGPRVPEDYRKASGPALWDCVISSGSAIARTGGLA